MRKILTVLILMVCVIVPSFAAVTDTMLNVGLQNTSSVMTIDPDKDKPFDFKLDLQADFNMIFNNGPGFDVSLMAEQNFNELELGVYYAHKIDVNNDFEIIVMAGPTFQLMGDFGIGMDVKCNFLFDLSSSVYFNIGTGVLMDIVTFPKSASFCRSRHQVLEYILDQNHVQNRPSCNAQEGVFYSLADVNSLFCLVFPSFR